MKITTRRSETANGLVVVVSVIATILAILGAAVSYTGHISRISQRSRRAALAVEIADGHLEYLFTSWRNIYRTTWVAYSGYNSGGTDYSLLGTNYFFTSMYNPGPAPTPIPYMSPAATPPIIPLPSKTVFPTEPNYNVTQYRIQAVDPMIQLDPRTGSTFENALQESAFGSCDDTVLNCVNAGKLIPLPAGSPPPAAYGPNTWQYSFFYLAAADVSVPAIGTNTGGTVTAKVRRVFEKKFDNPWTYAMFYVDDLELQPAAAFTIDGQIHTNGNLYIGTSNLTVQNNATTGDPSTVNYGANYVNGFSPLDGQHSGNTVTAPTFPSGLSPAQAAPYLPFGWNLSLNAADGSQNNDSYHEIIEMPASGTDPLANIRMYNQAGMKVTVDSADNVTYYNAAGNVVTTSSSGSNDKAIANLLKSAITTNVALWDARENTYVRTINLDINKIQNGVDGGAISGFNGVIYIADTTTNGTTVVAKLGGTTNSVNTTERGVRLINGTNLPSGKADKNNVAGLTVVSANPVYIQGDYNTGGTYVGSTKSYNTPSDTGTFTDPDYGSYARKGAAVIGDSINVLSGAWSDVNSTSGISSRVAGNTTVNAALVGGIVPSGTSGSNYSGGAENFIRFLEDWTSKNFTYYGSTVELYKSTQATGVWSGAGTNYKAGNVHFFYDPNFGSYTSTPPGALQIAAYLQQQRWYQVY